MKHWSDRDKAVVWHPFTQQQEWCSGEPLVITRGEGSFLIDDRGRRYLDGVSSLWCNVHGHNHPRLNEAIAKQLEAVAHSTYLGLTHPPGIELAERLTKLTGLDRVFYSDSGSSAVEIALKLAFQLAQIRGDGDRRRFLHLGQAYHGDTLGAVGVGGIEIFHRVFGGIVIPGVTVPTPYVPAAERMPAEAQLDRGLAALDRVLDQHHRSIAAFVVEPLVQAAAGMLTHPRGYLRAVAERCRRLGIPLIVDEVATGFGRTGELFACQHEGVTPDFLCLAKGITGGYLPLAATLTTNEVYSAFLGERRDLKQFFHGHTYTANPLACAAALASLDLLQGTQREPSSDSGKPLPASRAIVPSPDASPDRSACQTGRMSPGSTNGGGLVHADSLRSVRVSPDRSSDGGWADADRVSPDRSPPSGQEPSDQSDGWGRVSASRETERPGSERVPPDRSVDSNRPPNSPPSGQEPSEQSDGSERMPPDRRLDGDRESDRSSDGGSLIGTYAGLGERLQSVLDREIAGLRGVVDIRRVGAMVGIELGPVPWDRFVGARVCELARTHGVILRPLGDVVVWMPPLNISSEEIDLLGKATAAAIEEGCST